MSLELQTLLKANILVGLNDTASNYSRGAPSMFSYLAWSSQSAGRINMEDLYLNNTILPFVQNNDTGHWSLRPSMPDRSPQVYQGRPMDLFVATFPRTMNHSSPQTWQPEYTGVFWNESIIDWYFEDATLLSCGLKASQYHLRFSFTGLDQTQHVEVLSVSDAKEPLDDYRAVAGIPRDKVPASSIIAAAWDPVAQRITDKGRMAMRFLSYTSVMQAMLSMVLGATNGGIGTDYATLSSIDQSGEQDSLDWFSAPIFSTKLRDTTELSVIGDTSIPTLSAYNNTQSPESVQNFTGAKGQAEYDALMSIQRPPHNPGVRTSLKTGLEDLFFNITVSLASSAELR